MSTEKTTEQPTSNGREPAEPGCRFPELAEIQSETEKRILDNKRFLERFMDEDFADEEDEPGEDDEGFEEL